MGRVIIGTLLSLGMLSLVAAGPATTRVTKVDVDALVKKLGSADYAEREEAAGVLVKAYGEQGAEVEAASKRTDLDPQATVELQQIVAVEKPRYAAIKRAADIVEECIRLNRGSALASYDKVGQHDPKWDDLARKVITDFTFTPADPDARAAAVARMVELADKLKQVGCTDPLVRYYMSRSRQQSPGADMKSIASDMRDAVNDLEKSNYPVDRKCWGHARYVEHILRTNLWSTLTDWQKDLGAELDLAVTEWAGAVAEPATNDTLVSDLANVIEYDWLMVKGKQPGAFGDRGQLCDQLVPAWEQARPKDCGIWVFKGTAYVKYAWDARGSGFANTVTPDGWKLMGERLVVARQMLERAYQMDPADPRAATEMLTVELGQGEDRGSMELWWKRAMEANPDNYAACTSKMYYLEPKWHGSPDEMIKFGRECLSGGNWEGRIPFVLVDAIWTLSSYAPDADEYFARPEVWAELRSVYEPFLERYPDSAWDRSHFAYYATRCGQWEVANKQFDALGDHPVIKPFGTQEAYDYQRAKAKKMAAKT